MRSLNHVILVGRLGQTPELQSSKSGRPYTRLSLATHRRWFTQEEAPKELTDWHSIFVWGRLAETCVKHLQKGALVLVEGSLSYWQSGRDEPYRNAIHANEIRFLTPARENPTESDSIDNFDAQGNHNAVAHLG